MSELVLLTGDKNRSSWSVRAWLVLQEAGARFAERTYRLDAPGDRFALAQRSPSRMVPVLEHGALRVWDSLAITEYVAEAFPRASVWPRASKDRARARSACAEMHAGFRDLRTLMPMNARATGQEQPSGAEADIRRILDLWRELRSENQHAGPYLFGTWCAADAFFAPVVSRFETYGVRVDATARSYMDAVLNRPSVAEWLAAARAAAAADAAAHAPS